MDRVWVGWHSGCYYCTPFSLRGGDTCTKGTEGQECREQGACRPGAGLTWSSEHSGNATREDPSPACSWATMAALLVSLAPPASCSVPSASSNKEDKTPGHVGRNVTAGKDSAFSDHPSWVLG